MKELEKIQPSQLERARKIVRKYYFKGSPYSDPNYIFKHFRRKIEDIENFEVYDYKLLECYPQYMSDGSKGYNAILEVTYLSVEREIYFLRY